MKTMVSNISLYRRKKEGRQAGSQTYNGMYIHTYVRVLCALDATILRIVGNFCGKNFKIPNKHHVFQYHLHMEQNVHKQIYVYEYICMICAWYVHMYTYVVMVYKSDNECMLFLLLQLLEQKVSLVFKTENHREGNKTVKFCWNFHFERLDC